MRRSARPTCRACRRTSPHSCKRDQAKLYELVWTRMSRARWNPRCSSAPRSISRPRSARAQLDLRATGQVVRFDGFLKLYQEGKDDEEDEESGRLPPWRRAKRCKKDKIEATPAFHRAAAALYRGDAGQAHGRARHRPPSTYASTLAVLRERDYVKLEKKRLVPEDKGRLVTAFLESFFARYVGYDFTAGLEGTARPRLQPRDRLETGAARFLDGFFRRASTAPRICAPRRFWTASMNCSGPHIFPAKEDGSNPRACPSCGDGPIVAEARQIRRLHRLLELSRMQIHPHAVRSRRTPPRGDGERPA